MTDTDARQRALDHAATAEARTLEADGQVQATLAQAYATLHVGEQIARLVLALEDRTVAVDGPLPHDLHAVLQRAADVGSQPPRWATTEPTAEQPTVPHPTVVHPETAWPAHDPCPAIADTRDRTLLCAHPRGHDIAQPGAVPTPHLGYDLAGRAHVWTDDTPPTPVP